MRLTRRNIEEGSSSRLVSSLQSTRSKGTPFVSTESCRISRVKTTPCYPAQTSAHTHALAHPANNRLSASTNKRFFGNLHVMTAQLLPAQLLELQRRPQAARRLGLTQAASKGSIIVPKGELNPRARVTPHLSARQPTPHEILRGRQFFPAASAGARCSRGASLHSRPKPRIRR